MRFHPIFLCSFLSFLLISVSVAEERLPKVVCFGDSITKHGYYEVLAPLIGAETINAGVAGHNSRQGLKRMQKDVLAHQPDVVVVLFGTNDLRADSKKAYVPLLDYQKNLLQMVDGIEAAGAKVVICTLPPINKQLYFTRHQEESYDAVGGLEKLIANYRDTTIEVAATRQLPLVDLNQILLTQPRWMRGDGVHPSETGKSLIAQAVAEKVRPLLPQRKATPLDREADIIIYGGTGSGIMAAIQARRMNKSVILIEPQPYFGGMTSGGLGATDIGNKDVIGGLSREFYRRVAKHYAKDSSWVHETREEFFSERSKRTKLEEVMRENATMWTFEPKVAYAIFLEMLQEENIPIHYEQKIIKAHKDSNRITAIEMQSGELFTGKMFIDATYEGDLMARAKVSYRVGREANTEYDETLNAICEETPKNQFHGQVDPYTTPGDPTSPLLPLIQEGSGGTPGEGDKSVQAYNFRLCFTDVPENRLPLAPPANYDPGLYELAVRQVEVLIENGEELTLKKFCNPVWMPNRKTDINNSEGISTDFIGANYDYPNADHSTRAVIWRAHSDYVRGFWYFMSHEPRIPEELREKFLNFGPCKDEFLEANGWSRHLYVREARRMHADYVMTEHNCRSKIIAKDSIGMAAYGMDSHNCQRIVQNGFVRNEGDVQKHGLKPYPISYRAIIPRAEECQNLLVPVCVSSTHIAFGSIRMEPVFMVLGQSAGTAASLAIREKRSVQDINYAQLKALLIAGNQVLKREK